MDTFPRVFSSAYSYTPPPVTKYVEKPEDIFKINHLSKKRKISTEKKHKKAALNAMKRYTIQRKVTQVVVLAKEKRIV